MCFRLIASCKVQNDIFGLNSLQACNRNHRADILPANLSFQAGADEYYFDFNIIDESISLLINSKEQIIVEKLKSLLKFGITSTRFKDIFDFYYLINNEDLNKDKLLKYIDILIFQDESMREKSLEDVNRRLTSILNNSRFQSRINTANNNWLEIPIKEVIDSVLDYFDGLINVTT